MSVASQDCCPSVLDICGLARVVRGPDGQGDQESRGKKENLGLSWRLTEVSGEGKFSHGNGPGLRSKGIQRTPSPGVERERTEGDKGLGDGVAHRLARHVVEPGCHLQ